MKFTSKERKLTSNKKTMSVELGLGDTKKAIELLYSQYRNPIRTCVQELVSNAFDAMQDAGKADQPIKIQLPNAVNEFYFSVRDFGNSMDEETIKNVYMRVNTSTKSNSNNAIGGFGIGSKTPWAYTDTYILKTFLNGLETQYALIKGRSSVQIVYQGETTQENGTEVIFKVDASDEQRFAEAVKRISLCAKTKPIINSGMSLDFEESDIISPTVSVVQSKILDSCRVYVNLGGVLYRTDSSMFSTGDSWRSDENYNAVRNLINNHATIIISLPIGSVMPLQTREGLFSEGDEGKQNKAVLKRMIKNTKEVIESTMNAREKEVTSIESAIKYFSKGLLSSSKRFEFGNLTVSSTGFDMMKAGLYSQVTRKAKSGWGRKNKTGRKNTGYVLRHSELGGTVYFSEVSSGKARLISRFHDLSYNQDIIVLEKDLFTDQTVYEFLKKYTNAVDIHTVEIPKRVSSRTGTTVDKTRVVVHSCTSQRASKWKSEFFLTETWTQKTVVLSKEEKAKHSTNLYKILGYDIWTVADSNVKKLTNHDPSVFVTEDQAVEDNIDEIVKMYIDYRYAQAVYRLRSRNHIDFVLQFVSENKQSLYKEANYSIAFYRGSNIVEKLDREYGKFVDKVVKKMVNSRVRVHAIVDKAPLVQHINYVEDVKGQAKTDLENYTKAALNA